MRIIVTPKLLKRERERAALTDLAQRIDTMREKYQQKEKRFKATCEAVNEEQRSVLKKKRRVRSEEYKESGKAYFRRLTHYHERFMEENKEELKAAYTEYTKRGEVLLTGISPKGISFVSKEVREQYGIHPGVYGQYARHGKARFKVGVSNRIIVGRRIGVYNGEFEDPIDCSRVAVRVHGIFEKWQAANPWTDHETEKEKPGHKRNGRDERHKAKRFLQEKQEAVKVIYLGYTRRGEVLGTPGSALSGLVRRELGIHPGVCRENRPDTKGNRGYMVGFSGFRISGKSIGVDSSVAVFDDPIDCSNVAKQVYAEYEAWKKDKV